MATFTVEIKNINARIDKMIIAQGETRSFSVKAEDEFEAIQKATRKAFDGCNFRSEEQYSDGTRIGQICWGRKATNLYGLIRAEAQEVSV